MLQLFDALMINWRQYDPRLLELAKEILLKEKPAEQKTLFQHCYIRSLRPGDILVDDVRTETSFELVLARGHLLTPTMIRRLEHFNKNIRCAAADPCEAIQSSRTGPQRNRLKLLSVALFLTARLH